MKGDPLDRILLRQGLLSQEQIDQALLRQKARGGRFGTHLLFFKFITEANLVQALGEQFAVPGAALSGRRIPEDVVKRLPVDVAERHQAMPFAYDEATQTLAVALADPEDGAAVHAVRDAARALDVEVHVGSDLMIRNLVAEHYHGRGRELFMDQIVELPELFAAESRRAPEAANPAPAERIVLVSRAAIHRNFLGTLLEREGWTIEVAGDATEAAAAFKQARVSSVLVAHEMEVELAAWIASGSVPRPPVETVTFEGVGRTLLDNPAPYRVVMNTLLRSLQALAEVRCAARGRTPPYARLGDDLRALGAALGLRRLAVDGMQIAAHLLVPDATPKAGPFAFAELDRSLEIAQSLRFPWDVEGCLMAFAQRTGEIGAGAAPGADGEIGLAAQILALVWLRHAAFATVPATRLRTELRRRTGRLASAEIVETYVQGIDRAGAVADRAASEQPILVVGDAGETLLAQLRIAGHPLLEVHDASEALRAVETRRPAAVLVALDLEPSHAAQLATAVQACAPALLYAIAQRDRPGLVMDFLDAGFTDVFVPPLDAGVVATRIGRALAAREVLPHGGAGAGFRGTLREMPFVDLVQVLGANRRSVVVRLQGASGEPGLVALRDGEIVHAACGPAVGADAVFRIIAWREKGSFTVEPTTSYPPDNVRAPTASLLLQGCRLLDESPA